MKIREEDIVQSSEFEDVLYKVLEIKENPDGKTYLTKIIESSIGKDIGQRKWRKRKDLKKAKVNDDGKKISETEWKKLKNTLNEETT